MPVNEATLRGFARTSYTIGVSNQGMLMCVPMRLCQLLSTTTEPPEGWSSVSFTFAVNLLANTAYPSVLDGPLATIDVEERVGQDHGATGEEQAGKDGTAGCSRHPRAASSIAAAAGLLHLPKTPHSLFLPVVVSRHDRIASVARVEGESRSETGGRFSMS